MKRLDPTPEEQDAAERYVLQRPLIRPKASIVRALLWVLAYFAVNITLTVSIYTALSLAGLTPNAIVCAAWVFAVTLILSARYAVIGCVRLYQRYASERTRRRCLFRPTCSEYAILAVRKYGAVIGVVMAIYRVVVRCRGVWYRVDYP